MKLFQCFNEKKGNYIKVSKGNRKEGRDVALRGKRNDSSLNFNGLSH
jgi:hypothetical protein